MPYREMNTRLRAWLDQHAGQPSPPFQGTGNNYNADSTVSTSAQENGADPDAEQFFAPLESEMSVFTHADVECECPSCEAGWVNPDGSCPNDPVLARSPVLAVSATPRPQKLRRVGQLNRGN